ncbi:hypothetical protein P154DRAFT_520784 [Amniculicola lignicola CBS 123094]|uniref:Uncharacterized protein n=1 Tax=Amniculicola lignicola CBS 123094 TaxID=1392246 RepID=A0A6A5WMD8_9PLEO|nr:hypothetical protein P154DRAFT_520784 [Amniculicola lignicola CBS 123094]
MRLYNRGSLYSAYSPLLWDVKLVAKVHHEEARDSTTSFSLGPIYTQQAAASTTTGFPNPTTRATLIEQDEEITALPTPTIKLPKRKISGFLRPSSNSAKTKQADKDIPGTTSQETAKDVAQPVNEKKPKSRFAIWASKIKVSFRSLKIKRQSRGSTQPRPLVISGPTDFVHEATWSGEPLRTPVAVGIETVAEDVVQDDAESEWEDVEESRIFNQMSKQLS